MSKKKIGIIGAGDIGFNLAEILALQGFDVIIHNRYHEAGDRPSPYWLEKMGTVMDMNDSLQLPHCGSVVLTSSISDLNGTFANVITAGAKRSSMEETREDLARKNAIIMNNYAAIIAQNPHTLFLVVTNPVDGLTQHLIHSASSVSKRSHDDTGRHVVGVSLIDSMRLKNAVKEFFIDHQIPLPSPCHIEGISLGEHGPSMVPLLSHVRINGQPLSEFANEEQQLFIAKQTILRGNDIIKLTGNSSVVGPAHAAMHMIIAIASQRTVTLPCSVWDGQRCIGKVAEFTDGLVSRIVDVPMSDSEQSLLKQSEQALDRQFLSIQKNDAH
jgi:malate dehydrogenase